MTESRRGASMAVIQDGTVLLVRRGRPPLAGLWSLPGGKLEAGEAPEAAALREVREETGIEPLSAGPLGLHKARVGRDGGDDPEAVTTIEIDVFYGTATANQTPIAADDAAAARWVPLDALGGYDLTPGAAELILEAAALLADKNADGVQDWTLDSGRRSSSVRESRTQTKS